MENIANRLKTDATSSNLRRAALQSQTGLSKELFDFSIEKLAHERRLRLNGEFLSPFESNALAIGRDQTALAATADMYHAAALATPKPLRWRQR
jgi:hypothetical protein